MAKKLNTKEVTSWETQTPDKPAHDHQQPQLTMTDLSVLGQAIDIGFRKGAYNAAQAAPIGATFVKLQRCLEAVAKKQGHQG